MGIATTESNESTASRVGIYVYSLATLAAGVMDLAWGDFDLAHQPIQAFSDHIPGREVLAYIAGTWMIVGSVAVLSRRTTRVGGAALAVIYFIFGVFWVPRFYTAPQVLGFRLPVFIGVLAGVCTQLIVAAAGVLVYASAGLRSSTSRTVPVVRWTFGLSALTFGLNHLVGVEQNAIFVPKWMPIGREFWTILTGVCFMLAGLAILSKVLDALAAQLLGFMLLAFSALTLVPMIFAFPHRHDVWGGNAYNLAAVGGAWIFADTIRSQRRQRECHRLAEVP